MGKIKDITGQRFGKLTVQYMLPERKNRQVVWHCQCDCGKETDVQGGSLRSGHTKSCGCGNYDSKNVENLIGHIFNDITVIKRNGSNNSRQALWLCQCKCGTEITATTYQLKNNIIKCPTCKNKQDIYLHSKHYAKIIGHKFGRLTPIKPTEYRNTEGRVYWECKCACGNPNNFLVTASSLLSGNTASCGCLNGKSKGEEYLKQLFIKNNIWFKQQCTFNDLLSPKNSHLKYDFLIKYNNELILIEYDGIQHFQPINYFGGEKQYSYLKECDELKNQWAKKHNYKLIRISYTVNLANYTLEEILNEQFYI